mgnify:CR=1 FL=1
MKRERFPLGKFKRWLADLCKGYQKIACRSAVFACISEAGQTKLSPLRDPLCFLLSNRYRYYIFAKHSNGAATDRKA